MILRILNKTKNATKYFYQTLVKLFKHVLCMLGKIVISLKVNQDQINRAICTHRDSATKQHTLVKNDDGTVACTICGATFTPCEYSKEEVDNAVRLITEFQFTKI